jgi:IS30 family transposase
MSSPQSEVSPAPRDQKVASGCAASTNPSADSSLRGAPRKLDSVMKDHIYRLRARGHSLLAIARIIGISDRTIRRERKRDPFFRQRLGENGEQIADICFQSLRDAAPTKPHLVPQLYRLVYPDRYYYRPDTVTVKEHDATITEAFSHFEAVATPEQMRELQRRLSGQREGRKRSK